MYQKLVNRSVGTPATVPTATGDIPKPVENLASREPTSEDIARRVYHLYKERGLALHGVATEGPDAAA